ncbi:MAG: cytidine deaminase [Kiritimatiellae bacterium]|nr:cytidine deaminase [Kiritimatiellia bacterium]
MPSKQTRSSRATDRRPSGDDALRRRLVAAARDATRTAYAPYSKFRVGAAVRDERGRVFTGCNVENASYGLTICAERNAVFQAVAAGAKHITAAAVAASGAAEPMPCGACRQVLAEFMALDAPVWVAGRAGRVYAFRLGDLLPHGFKL